MLWSPLMKIGLTNRQRQFFFMLVEQYFVMTSKMPASAVNEACSVPLAIGEMDSNLWQESEVQTADCLLANTDLPPREVHNSSLPTRLDDCLRNFYWF